MMARATAGALLGSRVEHAVAVLQETPGGPAGGGGPLIGEPVRPDPSPRAGVRPSGGGWVVGGPGRGRVGRGGSGPPAGGAGPGAGGASGGGGPPATAAGFAGWLFELVVPELRIGTNPPPPALVGIDTYFWIDNYDGSLLRHSGQVDRPASLGGDFTVRIEGWAGQVVWDFGDGSPPLRMRLGRGERRWLGQAWPARSELRRTYEFSSFFFERNDPPGFPVTVTVTWTGSWTAGAEGSGTLAPITRAYLLPLRVQEIQQIIG